MNKLDALGRATYEYIPPREDVRLTERDLRWFEWLHRHGPLSSDMLHLSTSDTHRCRDTTARQLQKLRAAGYLRLPKQQRLRRDPDFHPYIYDLTAKAERAAGFIGRNPCRPRGHFWHTIATSSATAAIEVAARNAGLTYISGESILVRASAELAVPVGRGRIIPDQLFALRYLDGYRAFMLEVDCGTEPIQSTAARKSLRRSVRHYHYLFGSDLARQHYGLKAPVFAWWFFGDRQRAQQFRDQRARSPEPSDRMILLETLDLLATPTSLTEALAAAVPFREWRQEK